jgi:hypothetical protein
MFRSGWATALMLSVSLSVFSVLCVGRFGWYVVLAGAMFFFAASVVILAGDAVKRSIYIFFFIQFTASYFLQLSLYVTIISLIFFPVVLNAKTRLSELISVPQYKSLILLLSGWIVSLVYVTITNYGESKYHAVRFDIYFLLGFTVAYEVFFLLKLKLLDMERLIFYIAASGIVFICFVLANYSAKGHVNYIFKERFGYICGINPNMISSYLDLALPCAFFTALYEKRSIVKKVLMYVLSSIYACVILMTATRGSIPGIAIMAAYCIWCKRSKKLLFGVLSGSVIGYFAFGRNIIGRMLHPNFNDMLSNMGRVEMLRSAFKVLKDNYFFFGIGMNNFSLAKFEYGSGFLTGFDKGRTMSSHNIFAEIWLGWGMPGLLGWIVFNAAVLICLVRGNKGGGAIYAVVFAVTAFSMHGLVDSALVSYSLMFVYFSLIGVALFAASDKTANTGAAYLKGQK